MKKAELNQLQKTVDILDKESERPVYSEDQFILFENATEVLLAAIRAASLEIEEEEIPYSGTISGFPGFKEATLLNNFNAREFIEIGNESDTI